MRTDSLPCSIFLYCFLLSLFHDEWFVCVGIYGRRWGFKDVYAMYLMSDFLSALVSVLMPYT